VRWREGRALEREARSADSPAQELAGARTT
jgi:hypothetical protein